MIAVPMPSASIHKEAFLANARQDSPIRTLTTHFRRVDSATRAREVIATIEANVVLRTAGKLASKYSRDSYQVYRQPIKKPPLIDSFFFLYLFLLFIVAAKEITKARRVNLTVKYWAWLSVLLWPL